MFTFKKTLLSTAIVAGALMANPAAPLSVNASYASDDVTVSDVREEMADVFKTLKKYSAQERDEALKEAKQAMNKLDAKIDKWENGVREQWHDMTEPARKKASAAMKDIKQKRQQLSERYGELKSGADNMWDDLMDGFANAWDEVVSTWEEIQSGK